MPFQGVGRVTDVSEDGLNVFHAGLLPGEFGKQGFVLSENFLKAGDSPVSMKNSLIRADPLIASLLHTRRYSCRSLVGSIKTADRPHPNPGGDLLKPL